MKPVSLEAIRIFLAVAEARSFTAAAIRLGVTPAAASKAVKLLEAQHGVIVFVRNTRRVALTEAGGVLYASLLAATAQIDDAFAALTRFRDRPAGTLRLTVPRALGALVLKGPGAALSASVSRCGARYFPRRWRGRLAGAGL